MAKEPERWHLTYGGHEHTVEISSKATAWLLRWTTDGAEVASKKTSESTVVLDGQEHGAVRLKLPSLAGPARQVTLFTDPDGGSSRIKSWFRVRGARGKKKDPVEPAPGPEQAGATGQAHLGVGGTDFLPEPGSKAARREAWIREHPHLYAARRSALAAVGVLLPLGVLWLLRQLLKQITWRPDLPDVNLPSVNLPSIPWPHVDVNLPFPDVNLPDLPDLPSLPGWTQYAWPVLIAFGVAQAELRRRRQQDRQRGLEAPEAKEANGKRPGISKLGKSEQALKPQKQDEPEQDDKTTQACRVESVVRPKTDA